MHDLCVQPHQGNTLSISVLEHINNTGNIKSVDNLLESLYKN